MAVKDLFEGVFFYKVFWAAASFSFELGDILNSIGELWLCSGIFGYRGIHMPINFSIIVVVVGKALKSLFLKKLQNTLT